MMMKVRHLDHPYSSTNLGANQFVLIDFDDFFGRFYEIGLIYQKTDWLSNLGIGPKYEPIGTLEEG